MKEVLLTSVTGIGSFAAYFGLASILVLVYISIYMYLTPHKEVSLIKEGNIAAAIAFIGSLLGFTFPIYNAIAHSVGLLDFIVWGSVAMLIQILVFGIVNKLTDLSKKIIENNIAVAIYAAGFFIIAGLVNAASMTY